MIIEISFLKIFLSISSYGSYLASVINGASLVGDLNQFHFYDLTQYTPSPLNVISLHIGNRDGTITQISQKLGSQFLINLFLYFNYSLSKNIYKIPWFKKSIMEKVF